MTVARRYSSYRAPQGDRQIFCQPPWSTLPDKLTENHQTLKSDAIELLGMPLAKLRREARRALLVQAEHHTNSYTDAHLAADEDRPLIITGHQPELVHPGVWLKNFAAARLAKQVGGTAISLIVDNDLCRAASIRVPTGTIQSPKIVEIPFDQSQPQIPYEERTIADRSIWDSFGARATATLSPLVAEPLLRQWWPEVVALSKQTPQLGLAAAQARHQLQLNWGSDSLEVPQSQICQTTPFQKFTLHCLSAASRLRRCYNDALREYRQLHRLRSAAQPLPDLSEVEGWIETPFWIWTQENPARRPLFLQASSQGLLLSDRQQWQETLPLASDGDTQAAIERLRKWQQQGIKLRSRALITTLYARLLLADTFIHGIGGAKYDQVTDALCLRFFGILPAAFATLSGTLRLPIDHPAVSPLSLNTLRQTLRELQYHPEAHLHRLTLDRLAQEQVQVWVDQKKRWVQTVKTLSNASARHVQIVAANRAMQDWLQHQRLEIEREIAASIAQTRTNQLLESREYAFCLFPRDLLRKFLLDFSHSIP